MVTPQQLRHNNFVTTSGSSFMTLRLSIFAAAAAAGALAAGAASASGFYKGKQITLAVSAGAGGGYGTVGQIVARHFPRFIEGNPTMVPSYMPKAGGLAAANYIYNVAPKDGTVMGLLRNATAFGQAMGSPGIKYDVRKMGWVGVTGPIVNVLAIRKDSPVNTLEQMKKTPVVLGGTGKLGTLYTFPTALHAVLGYKSKIVLGYRGTRDVRGALDRNEVQGMVQPWPNWQRSHFYKDKLVNFVVQFGFKREPGLPDTPTMIELGRTEDEKKMLRLVSSAGVTGRNFGLPPGVPKARLMELRTAFNAMVKDPAYIEDMKKRKRMMDPLTGEQQAALFEEVLTTPKPLVEKIQKALGYKK
jgi:tripartite-type tricarboxylate transporter receptor subunit TctC